MCEHGDVVHTHLLVLSDTGRLNRKSVGVDRCISRIVKALNAGEEVPTVASCCGHGKMDGSIILADGRWLVVMSDEDARAHFDKCPVTIHGEPRPTQEETK